MVRVYELITDVTDLANLPEGWRVEKKSITDLTKHYCCSANPMAWVVGLRYEIIPPEGEEMNDEMLELEEEMNEVSVGGFYYNWYEVNAKRDELNSAEFDCLEYAEGYHQANHDF